ncbi:MAG TPA: type II toxin-antitoxin system RelE/ParE family toxin, partial [Ktedonobacteraceae bacterium]
LKRLEYEPELQGKPLIDGLASYRSVRAVGQRYRIIYRVDGEQVTVLVVTVGIRKDGDKKDVYQLAKKLIRLGLLDLE